MYRREEDKVYIHIVCVCVSAHGSKFEHALLCERVYMIESLAVVFIQCLYSRATTDFSHSILPLVFFWLSLGVQAVH